MMARVDRNVGPSNADVAKELTLLTKQGKIDPVSTTKPIEWLNWKPS
jgi:hypothetical protein